MISIVKLAGVSLLAVCLHPVRVFSIAPTPATMMLHSPAHDTDTARQYFPATRGSSAWMPALLAMVRIRGGNDQENAFEVSAPCSFDVRLGVRQYRQSVQLYLVVVDATHVDARPAHTR